jgi:hypothetical protein
MLALSIKVVKNLFLRHSLHKFLFACTLVAAFETKLLILNRIIKMRLLITVINNQSFKLEPRH